MNEVTAFTMGEAHFKECQLVHEFLNMRVRPRVAQAAEAARGAPSDTFHGALLRVITWMRTLWKLNEPADFQAATVAGRTLFEIAVDATLLHFDQANPPAKLIAWEESAKLKSAVEMRDYFARRGTPLPSDDPHVRFIGTEEARIGSQRLQHWNTSHHPRNRWTGRNLRDDAKQATTLFAEGDFEEFYETRYAQVCWNTHGSRRRPRGLGAVRSEHPCDAPPQSRPSSSRQSPTSRTRQTPT